MTLTIRFATPRDAETIVRCIRALAEYERDAGSVEVTPAQIRAHDVEAEESEAPVVIDAGDGRGRRAVELADEEACRIGRGETSVVGKAGVPAFGCRPVHGY